MKKIGILYDYLFYTIYRFWEKAPSRWWSDWKTVITLCFLMGFALSAIINIASSIFMIYLIPQSMLVPIIIILLIIGLHHYLYVYKNKWKVKILKFDKIDKKKDVCGIIVVIVYIVLIIGGLTYSYYLLSNINWD